jgi:hypothetical protein
MRKKNTRVSLALPPFLYKPWLIILFAAFPYFFLALPGVHAAQVTLTWDANTEPDLAGYKIYYGTSSRNYEYSVYVGDTTTYTVANLQDGNTYYFAATAVDFSNLESDYSTEVVYNSTDCLYSLSPGLRSFPPSGGTGKVVIGTEAGCSWTAVSNAPWILITSNSSASGNGTTTYTISPNSGYTPRTGTMTIAGQTLNITQGKLKRYFSTQPRSAGK